MTLQEAATQAARAASEFKTSLALAEQIGAGVEAPTVKLTRTVSFLFDVPAIPTRESTMWDVSGASGTRAAAWEFHAWDFPSGFSHMWGLGFRMPDLTGPLAHMFDEAQGPGTRFAVNQQISEIIFQSWVTHDLPFIMGKGTTMPDPRRG